MAATVFIGLGTNLGNREDNLQQAIAALSEALTVQCLSAIYETEPVGYEAQGWFLNMVIRAETSLKPHRLLDYLKAGEKLLGRRPTRRNGPRPIDLDILYYDSMILNSKELILPHPGIQHRAFVLVPLCEIAPDFAHPVSGLSTRTLLRNLTTTKSVKKWTPKKLKN